MPQPMSHAQRRTAFLEAAAQLFDSLEEWYDQHPEASFGDLEAEARRQRRRLMGPTLALLINGRDRGFHFDPPPCPQCGQPMVFQAYRTRTVYGLAGDTLLHRADYTCSTCPRSTLFPPGPETPAPDGPLA